MSSVQTTERCFRSSHMKLILDFLKGLCVALLAYETTHLKTVFSQHSPSLQLWAELIFHLHLFTAVNVHWETLLPASGFFFFKRKAPRVQTGLM